MGHPEDMCPGPGLWGRQGGGGRKEEEEEEGGRGGDAGRCCLPAAPTAPGAPRSARRDPHACQVGDGDTPGGQAGLQGHLRQANCPPE